MSGKCIKDYTVIYSQPSIEALENLIECFVNTFGLAITIEDMFYYNVFCKEITYSNYPWDKDDNIPEDLEIPEILTSECSTPETRYEYVIRVIREIMEKKITKPQWMEYIEMNAEINEYGQAPSTYLYIIAKKSEYEELAKRLIEFLYSPNMIIKMIEIIPKI